MVHHDIRAKSAKPALDPRVKWLNVESRSVVGSALGGHTGGVKSVVFSLDGKKIASGSGDGTVRLWNAESGISIGSSPGHTKGVKLVVFSLDGAKLVSTSYDKTVRLWDVESSTAVRSALDGHSGEINSAIFSLDTKKMVSSSENTTVRLSDDRSGRFDDAQIVIDIRRFVPTIFILRRISISTASILPSHEGPTDKLFGSIVSEADIRRLQILPSGFLKKSTEDRMIWTPAHLRGHVVISWGHTTKPSRCAAEEMEEEQ